MLIAPAMHVSLWALAFAASPHPEAIIEAQCRTQAADPRNPWALAHGMVAFGPRFRAADGRLAADIIVHDFARSDPLDSGLWTFATFEGDTPIEPHANLLVKALVESGLALSTRFPHAGGEVSLEQLVRSVERDADPFLLARDWANSAWTLDLLAGARSPLVSVLVPGALAHLEEEQAFLGTAMDEGAPGVPKQHQHIWSEPCGGFHLIQAVMTAARAPELQQTLGPRLARQQAIVFYRLEAERRVYDQALAAAPPDLIVPVLAQELKFYGHWLETVGRMVHEGVLKPTAAQRVQVTRARELLVATVGKLEKAGAFAKMPAYWATQHQLALDLTGDACHAVHGLALTGGPATRR